MLNKLLFRALPKLNLQDQKVSYSVVRDGSKEWWAVRLQFGLSQYTYFMKLVKEALAHTNPKGFYSTTKPYADCALYNLPVEPQFTGTWEELQGQLRPRGKITEKKEPQE